MPLWLFSSNLVNNNSTVRYFTRFISQTWNLDTTKRERGFIIKISNNSFFFGSKKVNRWRTDFHFFHQEAFFFFFINFINPTTEVIRHENYVELNHILYAFQRQFLPPKISPKLIRLLLTVSKKEVPNFQPFKCSNSALI